LLIGQTWHPMFITDAFPQVISFNTGVPFQPFSRNPQIKLTQNLMGLSFSAVLYSQRDFASNGPSGYSSTYLKNSALPALDFQVQFKNETVVTGAGVDYKNLTPRLETSKKFSTENSISSIAGLIYFKYSTSMFRLTVEGVYGQNMTDLMMLGGYAVSRIDSITGSETYTNIKAYSAWTDISIGKTFQIGLFAGYSKNLGADNVIVGKNYSRAENLGQLYRIAPRIQYSTGKTKFGCEVEYTVAQYGKPDADGKIPNGTNTGNTRVLFGFNYEI